MKCIPYKLSKKQEDIIKKEAIRCGREYFEEIRDQYIKIIDAGMLYALRLAFGFGEQRLKKAYFEFFKMHQELFIAFDAKDDEELNSLYKKYLENLGFDIDSWDNELEDDLNKAKLELLKEEASK